MKVRSPITFRNKAGSVVFIGDPVDSKELEGLPLVSAPAAYETKVVRQRPVDPAPEGEKPAAKPGKAPKKAAAKKAK